VGGKEREKKNTGGEEGKEDIPLAAIGKGERNASSASAIAESKKEGVGRH